MKTINLEEILDQYLDFELDYSKEELKHDFLLAMKEACEQIVDLCAENADLDYGENEEEITLDIDSILKTKDQIK